MSAKRTLIFGLLSPLLAAGFGLGTYIGLTRASRDLNSDFLFRLTMTTLAMTVPFWITLACARGDRRRGALGVAGWLGLVLAVASLGLTWLPIQGAIGRSRQAKALALAGVEAPGFESPDLVGHTHRLSDYRGRVVLVNVWATWCGPCKEEMPKLDRLYRERQNDGLVVLGLSTEDQKLQSKFADEVLRVSYPLLVPGAGVPEIYRTAVKYPANFLIDRKGRFQPAPSAEQPFEQLAQKVDQLIAARD